MAKLIVFNILLLCLLGIKCHNSEDFVVRIEQGALRGIKETSINGNDFFSFLTVPYAEPPVKELRFKDPVPAGPWKGVLDATSLPNFCPQVSGIDIALEDKSTVKPIGNEDCLYLRVHTPQPNNEQAKLPVMVFIHGGAFFFGGAQIYDPYAFMNKDIVLVIINYRVGILGFLSTEDSVLPGNMGLKDQQLALKWIQKNILHFGGDPESVTIFGESAGGASAHYQVLSPGSNGLFQRAILQSGTSLCPWAFSDDHKQFAEKLGKAFNCHLEDGSEAYVRCMQDVDSYALTKYLGETFTFGIAPAVMVPRVDGHFLPDRPEILLKQGKYNKVDIMNGINKDEGAFTTSYMCMDSRLIKNLNNNFAETGPLSLMLETEEKPEKIATGIYQHYLKSDKIKISTAYDERLKDLYGDWYFGVCADIASLIHVNDVDMNVYLYQIDHMGEYSLADIFPGCEKTSWVCHADDLFYLFRDFLRVASLGPVQRESDLKVREIMLSLWTNFARTGNPTPPGTGFVWDKATPDHFKHLSIAPEPKMQDDHKKEMRKFWFAQKIKQILNMGQDERLNLPEQKPTSKTEL